MKRLLLLVAALAAQPVFAQNAVTFDVDLTDPTAPVASWSTTPPAPCTASGSWSGAKAASGTETLPEIRGSSTWALQCAWPGETQITANWTNPTQNDDGSPYANPSVTRLAWTSAGTISAFDCLRPTARPEISSTDRPAGQTMHTISGLAPGTYDVVAFAVNTLGICSDPSNTATKTLAASATSSDSVSVKAPAAPGISVQ